MIHDQQQLCQEEKELLERPKYLYLTHLNNLI